VRDFASPGAKKEMVTVPSHATMIEALLKIDEHKVSALPVVDVQGALPTLICHHSKISPELTHSPGRTGHVQAI
jgi:CBS domain-containing protein